MALKYNLKKQQSIYQLRTAIATTTPQPSPSTLINKSNKSKNSSQPKNSCSNSFSISLDTFPVIIDLRAEAYLVDNKLAQVLALHAR